MIGLIDGFDWDEANIEKCQKHGISVEMIEDFFTRELRLHPDILHSKVEDRFIAIGKMENGMVVFVGFTYRQRRRSLLIRPVTARYMHDREVRKYDQTDTKI